jgi:transposase
MITDNQYRRLMKLSQTEKSLEVAAAKAGMDEKTGRKWRREGQLPSAAREPRQYRTRLDPFARVWREVEELLERDASVEAKTIFDYLCRRDPEQFQEMQLRTLQRRVKRWRAQKGEPREVYFPQEHVPGRQAQSDFTYMNELLVTIAGQPFKHLLYHLTLTYSNWEWGQVCFSESYESLASGVQDALWELGGVPQEHRTDSLSAAVRPPRSKEEFTQKYKGLLQHYGMKASHSSPGRGHENGEFAGRAEYEEFLAGLFRRRNQLRRERVAEELKVLRELPKRQLEACTKEVQRVSRNATLSIRNNYYSVPSQLIGERVEVRIYGGHLEVWYGGALAERLERLRGEGQAAINYRHIIHSLVKKPGAFAHYRFQASLFPRLIFRVAYDELQRQQPALAEREYVKLLQLAAAESEELVAAVLRELIDSGAAFNSERVRTELRARVDQPQASVLTVMIEPVTLQGYDLLLDAGEVAA